MKKYICRKTWASPVAMKPIWTGGNTPADAARIFDNVLQGTATPAQKNCVIVNAAFAIQIIEKDKSIDECINIARESLDSGKAYDTFKKFLQLNN